MNPENLLPLLLDLGLKSAIVVLAALVAGHAWRRASAANRHVIWLTLLATLLPLPLTEFLNPHWTYFWQQEAKPRTTLATLEPMVSRIEFPALPARAATAAKSEPPAAPIRWMAFGVMAWMSGAALVLLHRAAVSWRLGRFVQRSRQISDERLVALARESARGSGAQWELRESDLCRAPLVFGMRRPAILLPAEARDWTDARLSAVFLHEFGHVRRRDCLTRLLMDFACAIYWVNPLVWIASRKMRIAQEQACDDLVLSAGVSATDYASQIVEIVRSLASDRFTARHALAMAQPSTLETRVRAIVDANRDRRPLGRFAFAGGSLAIAAALGLCGAAQLRGADEKAAVSEAAPPSPEIKRKAAPAAVDSKSSANPGKRWPRTEITSETVSFDKTSGAITVSGNATIQTGGLLITADKAIIRNTNAQWNTNDDAAVPKSAARITAEKIILPKVELHDASVTEAINLLNRESVESDPAHKGVNIVLRQRPGTAEPITDTKVTINLSNIPVYEALQYIAKLSEMEISDGPESVSLYSKGRGSRRIANPVPGSPGALFLERANKVVFPHIFLKDTSVNEAVHFLQAKIPEVAPDAQGVNIVLKDFKEGNDARITMELRNAPLTDVVRYVTELANLDLDVSANAFYLHPHQP